MDYGTPNRGVGYKRKHVYTKGHRFALGRGKGERYSKSIIEWVIVGI